MHIPHLLLSSALLFGLADGTCGALILSRECMDVSDVQREWVRGWLAGIGAGRYRDPRSTDDANHHLRLTPEQSLALIESQEFLRCISTTRVYATTLHNYVTGLDLSEARGAHTDAYLAMGYLLNLRYLDLSWTQENVFYLLEYLSNLQVLNLTGAQVRDLTPLAQLANLRELNLTDIPAAALDNIPPALLAREAQGLLTIEYGFACLK